MIVFLFGQAGVGKNYVGKILAAQFGYYFWDADLALTPEMKVSIARKEIFTQEMRDHFTQIIIQNTQTLSLNHEKLVVAQALYKEKNRNQLVEAFPQAKFILVDADSEKIFERLNKRNNAIDRAYAEKIRTQFEKPLLPYQLLYNNTDEIAIVKQLQGRDL